MRCKEVFGGGAHHLHLAPAFKLVWDSRLRVSFAESRKVAFTSSCRNKADNNFGIWLKLRNIVTSAVGSAFGNEPESQTFKTSKPEALQRNRPNPEPESFFAGLV